MKVHITQRLFITLMLILLCVSVLLINLQPKHVQANTTSPHVYVNASELRVIQDHIRSGDQPWRAANDSLMSEANRALTAGPYRVTSNGGPNGGHDYFTEAPYCGWKRVDGRDPDCRDGEINPQANRQDYNTAIAVGKDVRALGLAYALTDDEHYARRAAYLIRVWALDSSTRMTPKFTNGQSNIELAITMPGLFYGTDLIRNSSAWSSSDQQAFERWSRDFLASGRRWSGTNNFEVWRLVFLASGGAVANDNDTLRYAFDRYKQILPEHIGSRGEMVKELGRTKSLMYSLYALNAFTQVAEIAHHNGTNLYDYSRNGRNLKLALDYHAPYAIDPSRWQRQQIAPIEEKDIAHYEVAYAYFRDSDYKRVIDDWGRPLYEQRTMGPVTLTHAAGNGNPAPPPAPTAAPSQLEVTDLMGLTRDGTVSGAVRVEAAITGQADRVVFAIRGAQNADHTEQQAPYVLFGDNYRWDTNRYPDGDYEVRATAYRSNQTATRTERVTVDNNSRSGQPQTIKLDAADPDAQQGAKYRDCPGSESGRCLGWIAPNEWVEWRDVQFTGGTYQIGLRAAPWKSDSNATFAVLVDGQEVTRITADAPVGNFSTPTRSGSITAGRHTIRLVAKTGHSVDVNYLQFEKR
ncbi:MAG: hypothetical protein GFH27_549331n93 [Chloroflexi bacterium AL-W]|nr:hypothetical protein [Chloroflexi bacterium AL-N1]NOK70393.1 hypothetical protein [Chloroflexi bacterium AL-N10]NOK78071.1 hypothetical protein [Chloroflexi bacterium AL-N5]NOK85170.1 hypothetical protein [Chloroflexi bacterium AL-W]NOK92159.1 hypothetical protein [Chloroflexi bacterium AL-N15]